jgi:hypothetical protein
MNDTTVQVIVILGLLIAIILYASIRETFNRRNGTYWYKMERPECPKCSIKMIDDGFFKTKWRCRFCEGKQ